MWSAEIFSAARSLIIYPTSAHARAMAASNPTTSEWDLAGSPASRRGGAGVQARQPRIHAAMPFDESSAAPSPARPGPSSSAVRRSAS